MPGLRTIVSRRAAVLTALALLAGMLLIAAPAAAAARVSVSNNQGGAAIDPTYATTLTLKGRGFQSIAKGHGGIYVLFGAVRGQWRPSQGGKSGSNYFSVPDSESKSNGGFAKFVAFPGSDTAGSANGGTISANGSWSTTINVPGATFKTYDRDGKVATIDCRKDTCGVLTIGAHGVVNGRNETFTRVGVKSLYDAKAEGQTRSQTQTQGQAQAPAQAAAQEPAEGSAPVDAQAPTAATPVAPAVPAGPPALTVDRASAKPGRIVAFSATGLAPGSQVSATFDDGRAGVGPLTVGGNGQVAGLLQLPGDLGTGTYELRLVGEGELPSVRFAVVSDAVPISADRDWRPIVFAAAGGVVLLGAIAFAVVRRRRIRAH